MKRSVVPSQCKKFVVEIIVYSLTERVAVFLPTSSSFIRPFPSLPVGRVTEVSLARKLSLQKSTFGAEHLELGEGVSEGIPCVWNLIWLEFFLSCGFKKKR